VKRRGFRPLYLAPVLALIALMAWALASPVGSSPDDDFHLASIWCANASNTSACVPTSNPSERIVPPIIHFAPCFAAEPSQSAACQTKYFAEGSTPSTRTGRGNFENNYPPVYYAVMSAFVGSNISVSVVLMRLVNIAIFIGMTAALFVMLPRSRRSILIWSWIVTMVPLGLFLIASNNPSSWAIIGIGSGWIALLGYFEAGGRRKLGLGIVFALASFMAAGARGDAALYLVLSIALVGILTFTRTRRYFFSALLPIAMAAVGVAFFLGSRQSTVVVSGLSSVGGVTPSTANPFTLAITNALDVPSLWSGVFGTWKLGWLDTALPAAVPLGALVAFIGIVFVGLRGLNTREKITLGIAALSLLVIPTYVLVKGLNVVGENVQPRYLLPLIVVFAGIGLLGIGRRASPMLGLQVWIIVAGLAVAESVALYTNMRRYITGTPGHGFNLDSGIQWWWSMPVPPMVVWIVGSVAFASLLVILVKEMDRSNVAV
jgi:hypothetical protein